MVFSHYTPKFPLVGFLSFFSTSMQILLQNTQLNSNLMVSHRKCKSLRFSCNFKPRDWQSWYHFASIWPPNDVFDYFTFYLSFSASLTVPLNKILASLIANDSYVRRCSLVSMCSFALIFEAINLSSRALILSDSAWNVSSACFSDYKNDFPLEKVKYLLYRWQL